MSARMGPGDVPTGQPSTKVVKTPSDEPGEEGVMIPKYQPPDGLDALDPLAALQQLREPFPEHMIEKLPKPMWKGAWDDKRGANCSVCHGYHVLDHCIHLDYVGHANVTNRLLEVDPYWEWEPMAFTETGTPLFSDGGLWIRLTVCGMTRIGYGDGKSVKEVIGDAIRNAAMRFGVGLDLWAKIDLHAERNPGDGETSQQRRQQRGQPTTGGARTAGPERGESQADEPQEAPNQDALDSLADVCDSEGIDRGAVRELFARWMHRMGVPEPRPDILVAPSQLILDFAAHLIETATDPPGVDDGGPGEAEGDGQTGEEPGRGDGDSTEPAATTTGDQLGPGRVGEVGPEQPLDTSDVEKKPEEPF